LSEKELSALDKWLRSVCWESELPRPGTTGRGFAIHRIKGRIVLEGGVVKMLQGVRDVFELVDVDNIRRVEAEQMTGKIVVIGRGLQAGDWVQSLQHAIH